MSTAVLERIKGKFGGDVLETHSHFGDDTALVAPESWLAVFTFLRHDPECAFEMLTDLTAVDYPGREVRLEVVVHLQSLSLGHRVRIKARVGNAECEGAALDSIVGLWAAANWLERECFDMFGVNFRAHGDLRRILLYPEFVGHPLRKDYPAERAQPLIAYRTSEEAGLSVEKQAPFGPDEGMSFSRNDWSKAPEGAN